MHTIEKICHWGDTHHPKWMDILRIGLGALLFYKGLMFASDPDSLGHINDGSDFRGMGLLSIFLLHYLPLAHLAGGLMIAIGLLTRFAILFQLPILIGAVICTGNSLGYFNLYSQYGLAFLVLALLILFLVYGSGPFSADEYMRKNNNG